MGQAKKETPRWRRKPAPSGPAVVLKGRHMKTFVAQQAAVQAAAGASTSAAKAQQGVLAKTGAYRFRRHLTPAWLLLGIAGLGLGAHIAHSIRGTVVGIVLGVLGAAGLLLLTRHLKQFGRRAGVAMAALTGVWVPVLTLAGTAVPWPALLFASWLPLMWAWAKHYRWRPDEKQDEPVPGDVEIWERLAAKNKWHGKLDQCTRLPGGGRQWHIVLVGAETHIGQVMSEPRRIAAAWGKSVTEAYAEPSPSGVESRGLLTILPRSTLEKAREWDGKGIDTDTGMAVVGRFPDGKPVHERYFIRMNGVRHTVAAGADGSGKSGLLDLGLSLSAVSGIIAPVILDPQEGQALPAWKDHVPYACGIDECMVYVRGLHAALFDRSRYLSSLTWRNSEGDLRKGVGFFDPFLTGLPIIEITLDEAPALLTHDKLGAEAGVKLADIGKLGRKAGFRLRLAIQVPSLAEFGAAGQPLRSMLVGGNTFCGRTGDKVTQGMIAAAADPSELPKYFPDGSPTVGLGYASGPDNRPSTPIRLDWVPDPYKVARSAEIRGLDDRMAEAMDRVMSRSGSQMVMPSSPLAAVPVPASGGGSAADAVLKVLDREMSRGDVIAALDGAYSIRAVGDALGKLTADGKAAKVAHGTYAPVRASLHMVSGSGHAAEAESAR
jgi:hypothetical protein